MSDTTAMPLDLLNEVNYGNGQPLCPACRGRLHPYKVEFGTGLIPGQGWQGVDYLYGFVAVCKGQRVNGCGFAMPLTPGTHIRLHPAT